MNSEAAPRVWVTGIGAVTAWGWGVEPLWDGLMSAETRIGDFERFPHADFRTHIAAEVPRTPPRPLASDPRWRRLSLADQFAVASADEALRQAGLPADLTGNGVGTYFGSSTGGMLESEEFYLDLLRNPERAPRVARVAAQQVSAPGNAVARWFRCEGPSETLSSACASGSLSVGAAFDAIRCGDADVAIAGGSDCLCRVTYGGFNALRSVDTRPCRPFRADREGLSLGEGGAVVILEREESARQRGARPLAVLAGAACASDSHHMTAPQPEGRGAASAVRLALDRGGVRPESVRFVNAHGTGTPLNDAAEWQALGRVFGEHARDLPVVATKGSIGHLLGSAGAVEAVVTVLCLQRRTLHPVAAVAGESIDSGPGPDLVRSPRAVQLPGFGVSINLGFGGCNAALVFEGLDAA